jgi:hypothetical protein
MLLWINGPFGGGKTQTAHELRRRLPGSVLCDPEHLGFGLHRMTPPALRGDFQDLAAWRQGVVEVLDRTLTALAGPGADRITGGGGPGRGVVIVPMTVVEGAYFAETVGRLRERGHDVRHFALLAERATVLRRLAERAPVHAFRSVAAGIVPGVRPVGGAEPGAARRPGTRPPRRESFAVARLDDCLERLRAPGFAEHVWTDRITVPQVAERIAASAGLTLAPNTEGPLRGRLRRTWTGLRHIRFD